jgi:hypothetical protein
MLMVQKIRRQVAAALEAWHRERAQPESKLILVRDPKHSRALPVIHLLDSSVQAIVER